MHQRRGGVSKRHLGPVARVKRRSRVAKGTFNASASATYPPSLLLTALCKQAWRSDAPRCSWHRCSALCGPHSPRVTCAAGLEALTTTARLDALGSPAENRKVVDDEERAFREAMRGARPLGGKATVRGTLGGRTEPRPTGTRNQTARTREGSDLVVEQVGETIAARRPDVGRDVVRRLRSGDNQVDARIDLHGLTVGRALSELERFFESARARGDRVVLIVHGRGLGSDAGEAVLRPAVWDWLATAAAARVAVMAFVTAERRHGGSGATLVRLRRRG